MVTFYFPRQDESKYIWFQGCFAGPMGSNGVYVGDSVKAEAIPTIFFEERGPHHDNGVYHERVDGVITFDQAAKVLIPSPLSSYPDRVMVKFTNRTTTVEAKFGFVGVGAGRQLHASGVIDRHFSLSRTGNGFTLNVLQFNDRYTMIALYRYIVTIVSANGLTASCSQRYEYWASKFVGTGGIDMQQKQSRGTVDALADRFTTYFSAPFSVSTTTFSSTMYDLEKGTFNPSLEMTAAALRLARFFQRDYNLPGEMDWGDLVGQASQQVNTTHINVIAFLRDLRNPTQLIPKLKNLRSLKTLADNYLTVKYGILPTISDIRNIIGAFGRLKPNLDRDGFTAYYASHTSTSSVENAEVTVEQHAKIAVGNEDNAFDSLFTGFERVGLLPNLENIWDLVPYSFVVDWFIDVGDFLERVDTHQRLMRFNVRYVTMSRKQEVKETFTSKPGSAIEGSLSLVRYHRWVSDQAPVPPLSLQPSHPGSSHWLEATALIVQRKK